MGLSNNLIMLVTISKDLYTYSYETLKIHSAILRYLFIDRLLYISVLVYFITTKATKYLKISYQKIT